MGDGGRASQGRDAALRRRLPHAARPPRDRPPPARVLRATGRGGAQGAALGHQPHRAALAGGAAGERRHPQPDEGLRAALHRGPGRARRHPGAEGAARRRHRASPSTCSARPRSATPRPRLPATYLDLLDGLAAEAASWPPRPVVDEAPWGPLPRVNLSLKITSLYSQIDPVDFDGSVAAVKDRLRPIFRTAIATRRGPHLDLEQFRYRDLTFAVFTSLLDEEEFRDYPTPASCVQAYLRDADRRPRRPRSRGRSERRHARSTCGWSRARTGTTRRSSPQQEHWPVPVFTHKPDTDAQYEKLDPA